MKPLKVIFIIFFTTYPSLQVCLPLSSPLKLPRIDFIMSRVLDSITFPCYFLPQSFEAPMYDVNPRISYYHIQMLRIVNVVFARINFHHLCNSPRRLQGKSRENTRDIFNRASRGDKK